MGRTSLHGNRPASPCRARVEQIDRHRRLPTAQNTELNTQAISFQTFRGLSNESNEEAVKGSRQFLRREIVKSLSVPKDAYIGVPSAIVMRCGRGIATDHKIQKVREIPVDSCCESASLLIPRKGGTGSSSGVGVLLWPGKPILCSR